MSNINNTALAPILAILGIAIIAGELIIAPLIYNNMGKTANVLPTVAFVVIGVILGSLFLTGAYCFIKYPL
jgi:hypothetical protein